MTWRRFYLNQFIADVVSALNEAGSSLAHFTTTRH
ncbi:MAG: hypothetical protein JWR19_1367 [Pedosphaera sp.]|nr:hypothetical protein [Pedosphaera sp.]